MAKLICFASCLLSASSLVVREQKPNEPLALDEKKTSPLRKWAHRFVDTHCFEERHGKTWSAIHSLTQLGQEYSKKATNPGAGMGEIVPFKTILKDGFARNDCIQDELYYHADKFHDNRHGYKFGSINISIVHYSAIVPREDREEMTPEVCFDFCRTVPDMGFFGIHNGRDCYCEPYFKAMASSSEPCDSVCEGDNTQMCGGKSKSQIFEMHMCADIVGDLKAGTSKLAKISKHLSDSTKMISGMAKQAEKESQELQKLMGEIGDSHASNMLRLASVEAGKLAKEAEEAEKVEDKLQSAEKEGKKLLDGSFIQKSGGVAPKITGYKQVKAAEAVVDKMESAAHKARKVTDQLDDTLAFHKEIESEEGKKMTLNRTSSSYVDAYYFVNPEPHTEANWGKDKSTCSGELAADPIFDLSMDECAYACDKQFQTCKAFNYFNKGSGICILFKEIEKVTQYDMCNPVPGKCLPPPKPGLLQKSIPQSLLQKSERSSESSESVPFPWKTKSKDPNATLFAETVKGMCTQVDGCEGMEEGVTLSDCSLMDHYECDEITRTEISDDGGTLKMRFSAWLESGRRGSACKVNPDPCPRCKIYSTCSGPYAETSEVEIKKGDVASYTWRSSGKVDSYEVFVGLYSTTCGLVDFQFQRGARQPWKTFELFAPKTDKYYMKFLLASYDGSGGGAVGADMEVKDVKQTKASVPRVFDTSAKCMARLKDYQGLSIKPDRSGKCKGCLKYAQKRCLKPDGTFPDVKDGSEDEK